MFLSDEALRRTYSRWRASLLVGGVTVAVTSFRVAASSAVRQGSA